MVNDKETPVIISIDGMNGQLLQTTLGTYQAYYRHIGWKLEGRQVQLPTLETVNPVPLKYQPRLI